MQIYRHYADYLIKKATSDLSSLEDFLKCVLFTDVLWQQRVIGLEKKIKGFEGALQRDNLNQYLKQETLDEGVFFRNVAIVIEGESSIEVEDIYQLLRQEAAMLKPDQRRKPLIAMIISLTDSYLHWIDKRAYPFLEITNILGPKTFIGFASINLYLIELEFYEEYFKSLFQSWSQSEVEKILDGSFSSLLFGYCVRRLWLRKETDRKCQERLESLRGFLNKIWDCARYDRMFYEVFVLFRKELPQLGSYFDERGMKMKSFIDTMPEELRKLYDEALLDPVIKKYEEKLRLLELEKEIAQTEREMERERAERERERAEMEMEMEKEKEREMAKMEREMERERERERAEREREREREERELKMTCQEAVTDRFSDISTRSLISINKLGFSECHQLLRELNKLSNTHDCEAFLDKLSAEGR